MKEAQMVPPRVILGRRIAGKKAFSVCTGNGSDSGHVGKSILRMTGFWRHNLNYSSFDFHFRILTEKIGTKMIYFFLNYAGNKK
ncbi:hypothetical protein ERO13_D09G006133v2 [Gossypium hirsutum]|uniref:Uncharacterized protein n=1 Tax=Gossypium darwinii TaxID=34276 RepID=A0A5D2B4A6_GOSDA|nr:hypothetical protein ERO13_D09G006133v2 [Gossypium hirsutum]TYG52194.1 hypothetical protein ES288_D09G007800v1 [Gossypium darwinii]